MAAPAFVTSSATQVAFNGSATERKFAKPGSANGQYLVVSVWQGIASGKPTIAGFTQIEQTTGGSETLTTFGKFIEAGDPAEYTIKLEGTTNSAFHYARYEKVNTTTPFNVHGGKANASSVNQVAPSITTTVANCLLMMTGANEGGTSVSGVPAGFTGRLTAEELLADGEQAAAGASGEKTATLSSAKVNIAQLIALAPEGAVPAITKPADQESEKGIKIPALTVSATNSPTSWEATEAHPLPAGLSINAEGKITGTPTAAAGSYTVGLKAKNGAGTSSEVTFTWVIVAKLAQEKPADQAGTVGVAIPAFQLGKIKPGTGIAPAFFSIESGFPEGILVGPLGEAEGTPTTPGTYTCKLAAEDVKGALDITTFTWTISPPLPPEPSRMGTPPMREAYPLHLVIGGQDFTYLLSESFTFSNTDPGGFEMASFGFSKDLPQIERGEHVRLSSGMQVAWEGRVKEVQRSLGGKTLIQCEGYGAVLKENSLAEIFVDRDLTKWGAMPLAEQISRVANQHSPQSASVVPAASGAPSLITEFTGAWESTSKPVCQAWYDAHGLTIGQVYYAWEKGANINAADTAWGWWVYAVVNEDSTGGLRSTGDMRGNGPGSGYLGPPKLEEINARFAYLELEYAGPGGGANVKYAVNWTKLAVYGARYRTKWNQYRGSDPVGIDPCQIVRYVVQEFAPDIVNGVSVEVPESVFTVPHAAYLSPVPLEQIIGDMAKLAGYHWGVWEPQNSLTAAPVPRLDFVPYPTTPTAWAWRSECESVDIRENLESLYDSARVTYTEPGGVERSVEVSRDNPFLDRVGLHRQVVLSMGTATKAAAEAWGLVQLALLNDQARLTGSATINQPIHKIRSADGAVDAASRQGSPARARSSERRCVGRKQ